MGEEVRLTLCSDLVFFAPSGKSKSDLEEFG